MFAKTSVSSRAALAALACVALVACKDEQRDGSVMAGVESLVVANPAISGLNDGNIVAVMDTINAADSAAGSLAAARASDREVRELGQMMVTDHTRLRSEGRALAKRLGVTPNLPANYAGIGAHAVGLTTIDGLGRGAGFDRSFVVQTIRMHEEALGAARSAIRSATNTELKTMVEQAVPVIERHLEKARSIQQRIGADTTAAANTARPR